MTYLCRERVGNEGFLVSGSGLLFSEKSNKARAVYCTILDKDKFDVLQISTWCYPYGRDT